MKLFVQGRLDGTGSCIYYCLYMIALSEKYKFKVYFNYVNTSTRPTLTRDKEIIDFFNIKTIRGIPQNLDSLDSIKYFLENKLYEGSKNYYIKQWRNYTELVKENYLTINEIFNTDFIDKRIKLFEKFKNKLNNKFYNVGIHLRRGDVGKDKIHRPPDGGNKFKGRYMRDEEYIKVLDKLIVEGKDICLYIFTDETDIKNLYKFKKYKNIKYYNTERDFKESHNVFRDWKMIVNLDCFIFGISTFAYVPALFNKNRKIYFRECHNNCNQYTMKEWELV